MHIKLLYTTKQNETFLHATITYPAQIQMKVKKVKLSRRDRYLNIVFYLLSNIVRFPENALP